MKTMEKDIYNKWVSRVGKDEMEGYLKAGMGLRVGWGRSPALIIVDVTNNFVDSRFPMSHGKLVRSAVEGNNKLLKECREAKIPIFFIRPKKRNYAEMGLAREKWGSLDDPFTLQDEAFEWPEDISPNKGENIIEKTKSSSFFETPLRSMLTYLGIDTLIITGISTSGCMRATVVDAFYSNFKVIVPEQCCGDRSKMAHDFSLFDIDMKFGDVTDLDTVITKLKNLKDR